MEKKIFSIHLVVNSNFYPTTWLNEEKERRLSHEWPKCVTSISFYNTLQEFDYLTIEFNNRQLTIALLIDTSLENSAFTNPIVN